MKVWRRSTQHCLHEPATPSGVPGLCSQRQVDNLLCPADACGAVLLCPGGRVQGCCVCNCVGKLAARWQELDSSQEECQCWGWRSVAALLTPTNPAKLPAVPPQSVMAARSPCSCATAAASSASMSIGPRSSCCPSAVVPPATAPSAPLPPSSAEPPPAVPLEGTRPVRAVPANPRSASRCRRPPAGGHEELATWWWRQGRGRHMNQMPSATNSPSCFPCLVTKGWRTNSLGSALRQT